MHYAIYNQATGLIRMYGHTGQPDTLALEVQPGERLFEGQVPIGSTHIRHGTPVEVVPEPTYRELRLAAYPAAGDQLDAIAELAAALLEQGIALPTKTQAWLDDVQAVKASNPKV
ncbi:hypothetical protein ACT048_20740 [Ectopseudomonas khazarica]|uniref:hypothetical protein n=1 Tax=Ectopseudomonas khazarica TaxID=2502979 RepID=UPI004033FB8B